MELCHVGRCLPLAQFRFSMHLQPRQLHIQSHFAFFPLYVFLCVWVAAAYLRLVLRRLILLLDILVRYILGESNKLLIMVGENFRMRCWADSDHGTMKKLKLSVQYHDVLCTTTDDERVIWDLIHPLPLHCIQPKCDMLYNIQISLLHTLWQGKPLLDNNLLSWLHKGARGDIHRLKMLRIACWMTRLERYKRRLRFLVYVALDSL
jgi:hypothetical protein